MEIPSSHAGVVKELKGGAGRQGQAGLGDCRGGSRWRHCRSPSGCARTSVPAAAPALQRPPPWPPHLRQQPQARSKCACPTSATSRRAVIELLVKPGDTVALEQSLFTVESDKASMEIPSPAAGVPQGTQGQIGDTVNIGDLVAILEGVASAAAPAATAPVAAAPPRIPCAPAPHGSRSPSGGYGYGGCPAHQPGSATLGLPHASPSVRKFARELGVPLEEVKGSGPKGRITQDDIQNFTKQVMSGAAPKAQAAKAPARQPVVLAWVWTCCPGPRSISPNSARWSAGPLAHQEDQRRQPAPQLGRHPARHQPRRRGHHRPGSLPRAVQQREREERRQGHHARLHDQGRRGRAQEVPEFNSSLDGDQLVMKNYFHIGFAARHAQRAGGSRHQGCRPEGHRADQPGNGRTRRQGARRQAGPGRHAGRLLLHQLAGRHRWHATSRPSSMRRKSPSWACARAAIEPKWDGKQFAPAPDAALS